MQDCKIVVEIARSDIFLTNEMQNIPLLIPVFQLREFCESSTQM